MSALVKHENGQVLAADAGSIMEVISRAAADPATDVVKLEKLLDMYERITARSAEREFNEAMQGVQAELPQITRDADNDHTKSRYARLETINKQLTPIITRHGFSMSFGTEDSPVAGFFRIVCMLSHIAGHSRKYQADVPNDMTGAKGAANKTAMHAFGSAMSYGRRYLAMLIFNLALRNEDNDGNRIIAADDGEVISQEQIKTVNNLLSEAGADTEAFCAYARIECVPDLRVKDYDDVVKMLTRKIRKLQQ